MKLLLINKNPVVSRMMLMSVPKAGFEIEECDSVYDLPKGRFEVVVIDDEMYDENFLEDIKQNIKFAKLGLITASKNMEQKGFDFVLTKPFLPTDLIEILREVKSELDREGVSLEEEPKKEQEIPLQKDEDAAFERFMVADEDEGEDDYLKEFEPTLEPSQLEKIVEVEETEEESPFVGADLPKGGVLDEKEVEKVAQLLDETKEEEPVVNVMTAKPPQQKKEKEEVTPESILTSLINEDEKLEPVIEPIEEVKKEPEESKPKEQILKEVAQESVKNLNASALKELLDGMQLDITIKISFPDK